MPGRNRRCPAGPRRVPGPGRWRRHSAPPLPAARAGPRARPARAPCSPGAPFDLGAGEVQPLHDRRVGEAEQVELSPGLQRSAGRRPAGRRPRRAGQSPRPRRRWRHAPASGNSWRRSRRGSRRCCRRRARPPARRAARSCRAPRRAPDRPARSGRVAQEGRDDGAVDERSWPSNIRPTVASETIHTSVRMRFASAGEAGGMDEFLLVVLGRRVIQPTFGKDTHDLYACQSTVRILAIFRTLR